MADLFVQQDPGLQRKRRLAQAMMQSGMSQQGQPVHHWTQGLNRALSQGLGAFMDKQAADQQDAQRETAMAKLAAAMGAQDAQQVPQEPGQGLGVDLGDPSNKRADLVSALMGVNPQAALQYQMGIDKAGREAEAKEAARLRGIQDKKDYHLWKKEQDKSGASFEGTGMEAQMLNIVLDQNIPNDDPRKVLAAQRLQRKITTATPEGTIITPGYNLGALSGQQDGSGETFVTKPPTESQSGAQGYYGRMVAAQDLLDNMGDFNPASAEEFAGGLTNITASPERQMYMQAANDWIRAKLRKESGAVIGEEEMKSEFATYFPVLGDSPQVIRQKADARKRAEKAMLQSTSPAFKAEQSQIPAAKQKQVRRTGTIDGRKVVEYDDGTVEYAD